MHKISNRIFEIFFKKTLDFLLAGFRYTIFLNMLSGASNKNISLFLSFPNFFPPPFVILQTSSRKKMITLDYKKEKGSAVNGNP